MVSNEKSRKCCPFIKEPCIEEKCALWMLVQIEMMGPLGVGKKTPVHMCVFQAIMLLGGTPRQMLGPPLQKSDIRGQG